MVDPRRSSSLTDHSQTHRHDNDSKTETEEERRRRHRRQRYDEDKLRHKEERRRDNPKGRSSSPRRRRSRSRSLNRYDRHGTHHKSPPESMSYDHDVLSPEDRDVRTVMVSNLSNKAYERDLKEILRQCGKIRTCKIIRDPHTNRSKGIAYVEFVDIEAVNKACDLTGKKLLGHSMIIETSKAEKNREYAAHSASIKAVTVVGGKQVKIENLHQDITVTNLKDMFSHFGTITNCQITPNSLANNVTNIAFLTFSNASYAKALVTNLDGFKLVNLNLKMTQLPENSSHSHRSILDSESVDRGGVNLGKAGRFELMAKLAEGSGLKVPNLKTNTNMTIKSKETLHNDPPSSQNSSIKSTTSQCIVISNFFDSSKRPLSDLDVQKIREEVLGIINKNGGCFHLSVDKNSIDGNVFVKCPTVGSAASAFQAFNGKTYENRLLSAVYLPINTYHSIYPESAHSYTLVGSSKTTPNILQNI